MKISRFWFNLILASAITLVNGNYDHAETRLIAKLLGPPYDSKARPPFNTSESVVVNFFICLNTIYEVSDAGQTVTLFATTYQEWRDPRFQWDPSDYDDLRYFSVPSTSVWTPDTCLYNTMDMYRPNVEDRDKAVIYWDGGSSLGAVVHLDFNARYTVGCHFDMTYFPFDQQNCTFVFGSWTFDQSQLDYHLLLDHVSTEREYYYENEQWDLISFQLEAMSIKLPCCKKSFKMLHAHLVIKRKPSYYIFHLIMPTVIISLIASFALFASAGHVENRHDKLQIGITALLAYCILLLTVSDQIPKGSSSIPLISWFFLFVMLQNIVKMYVAILLSYPDSRRRFKNAMKCCGDQIRSCLRMQKQTAVQSLTNDSNDDEDRGPEIVCLWVSMVVLLLITIVTLAIGWARM